MYQNQIKHNSKHRYQTPFNLIVNCIESIINSTTTLNASNFVHDFFSGRPCSSQKSPRHCFCAAIKSIWSWKKCCNVKFSSLRQHLCIPWPLTICHCHLAYSIQVCFHKGSSFCCFLSNIDTDNPPDKVPDTGCCSGILRMCPSGIFLLWRLSWTFRKNRKFSKLLNLDYLPSLVIFWPAD